MHPLSRTAIRLIIILMTVSALAACASSHILVGQARPAVSPDQVKVYLRPPAKFEEVAVLEASSRNSWAVSSQGKMNKVVDRLKVEAAKLGANGVLLQGAGSEYGGSVSTGYATATASGNSAYATGFGTSAAIFHKAGSGIAIYVTEE